MSSASTATGPWLHVHDSRVRDIIVHLARRGGASKFSGKIEAFLEEYLITETGLPTVPFGGRDEDVALLDAWLYDETAPPRYLLTAPAGRGKSALLVRWLQHLQNQGRVGRDVPASWSLVFVPISLRFETHRPDIFYEALAARLAEILGQELQPTHTDKGVYYADHCRTLASAAVAKEQRILIVLDGIDEALGERFDARWFPRNPGTSLRLVLSARWQAGDLDSSGWKTRLGWNRDVRTQSRELPVLARDGVRDLLIKMGGPTDVLASYPNIVDRLYELAEGEPLDLSYYAEDIWCMGEAAQRLTLDNLAQMRPGLGAYFARWLDDQERLWGGTEHPVDRRRVDAILAILACAHGRLTGADLRALLTEDGDAVAGGRFLEQLQPIQRFVIGLDHPEAETAGYILSHPKLGIHLREEHFDPEYIQTTQAAFVRWGRKTVERLNNGALLPVETPVYLLQYHAQHLWDAVVPAEAFLELVEQGWWRAWERFEGGYRGFSRDIRLAYEALSRAHVADQSRFTQRLRCQLVLSSIHSIGANTPWELLIAAFKAGVLTYRQVVHWLDFTPSADRAIALSALALHLPAELGAEVLAEALTVARAIKDSFGRAHVLGALAPHLPAELGAEVLAEALTAARTIKGGADCACALSALAPHLPAELLPEALTVARAIKEGSADRAEALGALAPHLPAELGAEVLAEALTAARTIEGSGMIEKSYLRARALGALAPHLPAELAAEVLAEALTAARTIENSGVIEKSYLRARALGALAPHLPAELAAEVLAEALTAARTIEKSYLRARALGALAPHLPVELGAEVLVETLTVARTIEDSADRARALGALAPHLPAALLPEALTAARTIEDSADRAEALGALALHLPAELGAEVLAEALTVARAIKDSFTRVRALGALAPHLPTELGAEVLAEALTAARTIENSYFCAEALGTLAPLLPAELLPEALTVARTIEGSNTRARVLGALAPLLPAELLPEALTAARTIELNVARAEALGVLAPLLPAELGAEVLAEALTVARTIEDSDDRARALGKLAPHLPAELGAEVLAEALTVARTIEDSDDRARALGALAPHLPVELGAEVLAEALTVARTIENSFSAKYALGALAPHLPAELLPEALTVALAIKDSDDRVEALGALAPHLPVELGAEVLAEALTVARTIENSFHRARVLGALAPLLPAELLPEALTAARTIEDSFNRACALGALAPHLPAELLPEALTVALAIKDSADRVEALGALAPQLSGNLLQQGFEALLDVLPMCRRNSSWFAVSSFFPFLEECQGPKGLEDVRRAIIDTARWWP